MVFKGFFLINLNLFFLIISERGDIIVIVCRDFFSLIIDCIYIYIYYLKRVFICVIGFRLDRYILDILYESYLRVKIVLNCKCVLLLVLFCFGFNVG